MMSMVLPRVRTLLIAGFFLVLTCAPKTSLAQFNPFNTYSYPPFGYSLTIPDGWIKYESTYTALNGGTINRLIVTQQTDTVSRPTKFFSMTAGSPESIFGVNKKVIQRVTREQLVDFMIDQNINASIGFVVKKTWTSGDGDEKVYITEATYKVPGYEVTTTLYVQFKNGKTYLWSVWYLTPFAHYAPTLQSIVDSLKIRTL